MDKKYYVCFDVGLTGFFSIIEYKNKEYFKVLNSEVLICELKEDNLYKTDSKKKSTAIVKNQLSYTKNKQRIVELLKDINKADCTAFIEQLTPRPFHSKVSIYSLGDSGAICRAICEELNIHCIVIPPKIWKDGLGVTSDKETSINFFKENILKGELHKDFNLKKKLNHNQVESVLIAYWHYKL